MWQDECGAQAMPLTHALWLFNLATGVHGTLTSSIITCIDDNRYDINTMLATVGGVWHLQGQSSMIKYHSFTLLFTRKCNLTIQPNTIFSWARQERSLVTKVSTFKLPCCQGQLAPFPRETARIDHVTSYNKAIHAVSLGNGASCPWQHGHLNVTTLWTNFSRALLNWKS